MQPNTSIKVSYSQKASEKLFHAIEDNTVTVHVNATPSNASFGAYEAYMLFHTAAPSQSGPVYLKLYDEKGTRTNNTQDAVKADWSVQKDNEPEKVIQTLHQ